jgi:3-hydroxypropanoate dehydrogenase
MYGEPLPKICLDKLFDNARTHHGWQDRPIPEALLHEIYDHLKWAPTCVNGSPVRILFLKTHTAKQKLAPALMPKNLEKTLQAPITAIIAEDLEWHEHLPRLMPHTDYYSHFAGDQELIEKTSFRNSSLQGAYFILAARAMGLDCGPMSGFDNRICDAAFFAGTSWRSNFLCNIGYGDPSKVRPRSLRLSFDESCKII